MALKRLVDIDEKFPVIKKSRLGAAPQAEDVLDNVGSPDISLNHAAATVPSHSPNDAIAETPKAAEDGERNGAAKKRERTAKRVGQGVHKGRGTDARRYRKTGRTYQFGARVSHDFAEGVKVTAAARNVTIGELLEEMRSIYDSISAISSDKQVAVKDLLSNLEKQK